jgi:hypothetical protein
MATDQQDAREGGVWITEGFASFSEGTCGNAGQNLYVSRAGVLQRIHQYDLTRNGYTDIVFCNSQNHGERPPATVYEDVMGQCQQVELPADGARSGVVADLNGSGCDDLVLANHYGGEAYEVNSYIYYGGAGGWSERRTQRLPTPRSTSVAAGDLNGDGRTDLAFLMDGRVRIFYQSELGFEPKRYVNTDISGEQICAADLDGDGCADLLVRDTQGVVRVFWGGPRGIGQTCRERGARVTEVPVPAYPVTQEGMGEQDQEPRYTEYVEDATPLVHALALGGAMHVFVARRDHAYLVPVTERRTFGEPLVLACARAMSVAVGDVDGDGYDDLVVASRERVDGSERSWVYWGSERGFLDEGRTALPSHRACDVAVGDLDGSGRCEIVICQNNDGDRFTVQSPVYSFSTGRTLAEPVNLESHDARRVFIAHPADGGCPSVVFANYRSRNKMGDVDVSIYLGGPGGYAPDHVLKLRGRGAVEAVCCDLNDNGRVDVVLANCSENSPTRDPGSFVYYHGLDGFGDALALPTFHAHGVACADLNRNGYLDLVFGGFNNPELLIFWGSADGFARSNPTRIVMEHEGVVYDDPRWIYLADLNNDGWLDLIIPMISYDRSLLLWGGPDGFSMERCQALSVWQGGASTAVADLTGNGYLDLAIGGATRSAHGPHDSFVHIYWNGPEGLREDRRTLLPANHVNAMAFADLNGNRRLDLYVCNYADGRVRDLDSSIYWNREGVGFRESDRTRLFTHSASGCFAADLNGNGYVDLAVANHKVWGDHTGYSEIWWNGPEGFDSKRTTRLPTCGPHGMTQVGPGNIRDRGPEETYVSKPFKLPEGAWVQHIGWDADVPPRTWVRAQLRFADRPEDLDGSEWVGSTGAQSWFETSQEVQAEAFCGKWVQYRLALGAENSGNTPRVTRVEVGFRPE